MGGGVSSVGGRRRRRGGATGLEKKAIGTTGAVRTSWGEVQAVHGDEGFRAGDGVGRDRGCGFLAETQGFLRASRRRGREARGERRDQEPRADAPVDRHVSMLGAQHRSARERLVRVSIYRPWNALARAIQREGRGWRGARCVEAKPRPRTRALDCARARLGKTVVAARGKQEFLKRSECFPVVVGRRLVGVKSRT